MKQVVAALDGVGSEWLESFKHFDSQCLELPADSANFSYQQQESRTYWVVGSPGAVEMHSLTPLPGTSVEKKF
jgi:hypothetical protein